MPPVFTYSRYDNLWLNRVQFLNFFFICAIKSRSAECYRGTQSPCRKQTNIIISYVISLEELSHRNQQDFCMKPLPAGWQLAIIAVLKKKIIIITISYYFVFTQYFKNEPYHSLQSRFFHFLLFKDGSNPLHTCHGFSLIADIYEKVSEELEKSGDLDCECIGGGRIRHDTQAKKIHVYGYSVVRCSPTN